MKGFARVLGTAALIAVVAVSASVALSGNAGADSAPATHGRGGGRDKIYFFARPSSGVALVGQKLPIPNPLVSRPSGFPLFEDGQWVLDKLHWSGWGSPVARARGLSSSSNDDPNAEQGKRIITWAKVRLSQPGVFRGHRVYRCIKVTVPPPANYGPIRCLQRQHRYIGLMAPGSGTPVGVGSEARQQDPTAFLSPDRQVFCGFDSIIHQVSCGTHPEPPTYSGTLHANGRVEICSVPKLEYAPGSVGPPLGCYQQWEPDFEHFPTLAVGKSTSFGGFRCASTQDGITCVKASGQGKDHGFRVNKDEAVEVGS